MIFRDRKDAGEKLAEQMTEFAERNDVLVLALPRGGVPVAFEVANKLKVALDILPVRKLGVPGREELAMGAVASGGTRVLNRLVVEPLGISEKVIDEVTEKEERELERLENIYRSDSSKPKLEGKIVILIDDGLATGATMRAATFAARRNKPAKIVIAVPLASPDACQEFAHEVDRVICIATPQPFHGVGMWYRNFSQTTDNEVRELLDLAEKNLRNKGEPW